MGVENQSGGTSPITSITAGNCRSSGGAQPETVVQLKGTNPVGNDHALKVRKPYTITKQREKWTEEEHQKFLEALKLYGRGWRQIEEHVGTKTAVQIRSHAQKFFSKVIREGSDRTEGSTQPIEIPPPRPKRKPVHPYPRKFVDSSNKGISVQFQQEKSPSLSLLVAENENKSPTSVLSPVGSDTLGSPVSDQHNCCLSPTSCTTDVHSFNLLPVEKESEYMTSDSSAEEEKGSLSSVQVSAGPTVENLPFMEFDLGSKDNGCTKGEEATDAPLTTIKLFGRTVLVTASQKPSSLVMENFSTAPSNSFQENFDIDNENSVQALQLNQSDTQSSLGMICNNWGPWSCGAPVFHCMEFQKEDNNSVVAPRDAPLPWWTLYQGLPFPSLSSYNPTPIDSCVEERAREKEKSCTGSNTGSIGEVENGEKNLDAVDSSCQHHYPEERPSPRKCMKGFVPYKRCLAERDGSSSVIVVEEQEAQRARVCL
ncbi:hypothetical protein L1049_028316 [Liquidambar formosana]|uniref:Uncharacterized protein n=1 Tax=Liquidambar formosana TaxID=63359 RepID=A0AAP0WWU9_LIQFO